MVNEIDIDGLEETINNLDELPSIMRNNLVGIADKLGELMVTTAQRRAPVAFIDGGTLRDSINARKISDDSGIEVSVGTAVHYAPHVEFGTGERGQMTGAEEYPTGNEGGYTAGWPGMEAQPFLRPAFYDNLDDMKKAIESGILENVFK